MTASNSNERISEDLPNSASTQSFFGAAAAGDRRRVNAAVTYAPLPVWNYSHWIGTVTTPAAMVQDRPE
jgi:hypothetical protein